jgi:cysteine desulfurase family protein
MIYLDQAATSWPKPAEVAAEIARAATELTANAGRGSHRGAIDSARLVFDTRSRLAACFGIAASENLVFTRGCTESLNLVLKGWLRAGDRVLVSPLEHNSVMRPLTRLAQQYGVVVNTLPADPLGRLDLAGVEREVQEAPPALVVAAHASNVNGVVQDLAALRRAIGAAPLLIDAAQTAGVLPIDVRCPHLDFLACSLHKGLLGPTGVGLCYLAPGRDVAPLMEGGTGSRSESLDQPEFRPDRYEAGTLNLHGIAGVRGALLGLDRRGWLGTHQRELCLRLIDGLRTIGGVRLVSPTDGTALCVALNVAGFRPEEVALALENPYGVYCRAGLHCAPSAHRHLGTFPGGVVRLSPGWGNTAEEIDTVICAVRALAKK